MELNEKFKKEKGDSSMIITAAGNQVSANDFMNFNFEPSKSNN